MHQLNGTQRLFSSLAWLVCLQCHCENSFLLMGFLWVFLWIFCGFFWVFVCFFGLLLLGFFCLLIVFVGFCLFFCFNLLVGLFLGFFCEELNPWYFNENHLPVCPPHHCCGASQSLCYHAGPGNSILRHAQAQFTKYHCCHPSPETSWVTFFSLL